MTDRRFFMITGTVMAVAIAVSLYYINSIHGCSGEGNERTAIENCADIFRQSIRFNGMSLNRNLTLSEYSRKGKLLREGIRLGELMGDKGCIALLSTNNCTGCVKNEIALLRKIDNQGKILFIYDSPVHENNGGDNIPTPVYYEFDDGELIPGLEKMMELPLLLYVEDGRVTASCIVSNYSRPITTEFHKFLKQRMNDEE